MLKIQNRKSGVINVVPWQRNHMTVKRLARDFLINNQAALNSLTRKKERRSTFSV